MKNYISDQSGRSMIEMLGVLAIVGVLSIAGIAGYSKAMAKYKTNRLIDQLSTIATNIKTTFAGQGNYKGLNTETAYNLGVFPEETVKDCANGFNDQCVRNVLGGNFGVLGGYDTYNYDEGTNLFSYFSFKVAANGLTKESCAALVGANVDAIVYAPSTGSDVRIDKMLDEDVSIDRSYGDASGVVAAANLCDCGSSEATCGLIWVFN